MSERHLPARRYDDQEIARLLKRATELSAQEPHRHEREGMTLTELEAIARDAGIDPSLVRRAASELDREPARRGLAPLLAGDVMALVLERTFEGELDSDALEGLVPMVNQAADTTGTVSLAGRTLNFSGGNQQSSRAIQILVSSRNGQTQVRIEERYGQLAGGLFGGMVGGGGFGLGMGVGVGVGQAIGSALLTVGLPAVIFGGAYLGARTIFRGLVRKRRKALTRLLDEIGAIVADHQRGALGAADPLGLPDGR